MRENNIDLSLYDKVKEEATSHLFLSIGYTIKTKQEPYLVHLKNSNADSIAFLNAEDIVETYSSITGMRAI